MFACNLSSIYLRRSTRGVPKANDLNQVARIVKAINDTIRADNNFANERVFKLRHNSSKFRRLREKSGSRKLETNQN